MQIAHTETDLEEFVAQAALVSPKHPVLVDQYVGGREIEVDAVADREGNVLIPGIMEHVERAGIHSGDSIALYPAPSLSAGLKQEVLRIASLLAREVAAVGLLNIQFVLRGDEVLVLEVNPRASRTVPFLSKVTGVPIVSLAVETILGRTLREAGYEPGLYPEPAVFGVKAPVFSFGKLQDVDVSLGPEMKSTGEVMGLAPTLPEALYKAFVAAGMRLGERDEMLATIADKDKSEALPILARFAGMGWRIHATSGTADALEAAGLAVERVAKIGEAEQNLLDLIRGRRVAVVLNTLTRGRDPQRDGFRIRRAAVEHDVVCLTSLDTAAALAHALTERHQAAGQVYALQDLHGTG